MLKLPPARVLWSELARQLSQGKAVSSFPRHNTGRCRSWDQGAGRWVGES